jgi:salicylate hydroxylase
VYTNLVPLAISGLSTALGLALSGHKVRVLEKSPAFGEPPGGIRIPPNVTKILVGWGLEEELRKRAHLPREGTDLWDCKSFNVPFMSAVILILPS